MNRSYRPPQLYESALDPPSYTRGDRHFIRVSNYSSLRDISLLNTLMSTASIEQQGVDS